MLLVTGDTHGDFKRFSKKKFGKILTKDDIVIICGDMGLLWANDKEFQYWCKFFKEREFQTLFVAGNHENYNMLESYPVEEWNGGKVRKIVEDKVIHLERGQVFNIEDKKIFTFGGASSHDIEGGILDRNDLNFKNKRNFNKRNNLNFRILNESWWKQELPTEDELQEGLDNLKKNNNKVDIIISHCCSNITQTKVNDIVGRKLDEDILTNYFDKIEELVEFKQWFFGHYHKDVIIDNKHILVYNDLKKIDKNFSNTYALA